VSLDFLFEILEVILLFFTSGICIYRHKKKNTQLPYKTQL
jgi:hypothetical protein